MRLRQWQTESVDHALKSYLSHPHFLCLATPGAGKTVMAAELAKRLFQSGSIDLAICFSPSVTTAEGMRSTFSSVLSARFDSKLGAIGGSFTYQSMQFLQEDFWQLLETHRVLVVFDEIHHCSGTELGNGNSWGDEILLNIQNKATYTLALTGTPWRSDNAPVVLSRYLGDESRIHCDYRYGLQRAITDGVCRAPKVVLVDNNDVSVTTNAKAPRSYSSLGQLLLQDEATSYRHILSDDLAIQHILSLGCLRLASIRRINPAAGGLIVASSTEHAATIHRLLTTKHGQSSVLVTYKEPDAAELIQEYRCSDVEWIVSVGMVSEGTDIPRLQVCCHLSRVRTELYFRQVLGRIVRTTEAPNQEAWLYTFAEPSLVDFSNQLEMELPDHSVIIREPSAAKTMLTEAAESVTGNAKDQSIVTLALGSSLTDAERFRNSLISQGCIENILTFQFRGDFREQIVAAFELPAARSLGLVDP